MKSLKNLTGDSLEQLIDYNVVDQNGDEIGTLHSLWSDPDTGAVEFLGVKTGWLFGHNHVVPAGKAELDETANVVRLPYTEAFIKEAPSISADAEISEAEEDNIYRYYGLDESGTGTTTTGTGDFAATTSVPAEAAGATALAGASEVGDGASQYATPVSGDASRWRRTSRPNEAATGMTGEVSNAGTETPREQLLADAASSTSSAGSSVRSALDDLSPSDSSGTRQLMTTASPGSYGTSNLYGSTGMGSPVSADATGTPMPPPGGPARRIPMRQRVPRLRCSMAPPPPERRTRVRVKRATRTSIPSPVNQGRTRSGRVWARWVPVRQVRRSAARLAAL